MSVETEVKLESKCKCQRFSCESAVKKISDGVYEYNLEKRFRYVKDDEGTICDGGYVDDCIAKCQIKIDRDNGIVNPADMPIPRDKSKANKSSIEYQNAKNDKISFQKDTETKTKVTNNKKNKKVHCKNNSRRNCLSHI